MKSTDTIYDLKLLYEEEEGIVPNHQTYFCGPVAIESDKILVSDLLEYNNTFDVKLQKAATLKTDKDVTVLYGPTRNDFQKLYLTTGGSKKIEFKKGKFGIVTSTRTIGEEKIYQVQRYKLPSDKEQNVVLKSEGGDTVAFLVTKAGEEKRLEPEVMEFKFGKALMERVKDVMSFIDSIVECGKH